MANIGAAVGRGRESLTLGDLQEWFLSMGLEVEGGDEATVADQLRDGILLCQLINKIKPSSVEVVRALQLRHYNIHSFDSIFFLN